MRSFPFGASKPTGRGLIRAALRSVLVLSLAGPSVLLGSAHASADAELCLNAHERAQVDRLEHHYVAARERLLVCAQRECPRLVSTDCTTWLAELEVALPTVVFAVSDDTGRDLLDARVFVNGSLIANHVDGHAVPLDPGVYKVRFEADGYAPDEQTLSVRDGEKSRLARGTLALVAHGTSSAGASTKPGEPVTAAHDPRARRLRIATYTLAAAAVASFAVTLGAGIRGIQMKKQCDDSCSDAYAERGKALYRTVNASAIAGGALLVSASITLYSERRRATSRDTARLSVGAYADASSAQLTAWGHW